MLRIVTDGATDMPASWAEEYDIKMLPLMIRFGDDVFIQGVDITNETFYPLIEKRKQIPQTSLPSPFEIARFYNEVADQGDTILSIHISSLLSGTYSAVVTAIREIGDRLNIIPVDSLAGSAAVGLMCREARIMERNGKSIVNILARLEELKRKLIVLFTLDNLDYARLNGRVSALQSMLSSVLKIKPIVILKDGILVAGEKARTRQRALDKILELAQTKIGNQRILLAVVHAADSSTAHLLVEKSKRILNLAEIIITDLAIPVAANLGPGTVGIVAIPVE